MWSRRALGLSIGAAACGPGLAARLVSAQSLELSAIALPVHEQAMRLAIAAARANPTFRSAQ